MRRRWWCTNTAHRGHRTRLGAWFCALKQDAAELFKTKR